MPHLILANLHEGNPNVAQDAVAYTPGGEGHLIQGHAVHLDGSWVLLLLKVDVPHIYPQQMRLQHHSIPTPVFNAAIMPLTTTLVNSFS